MTNLILFFLSFYAFAALPPYPERTRQIQMILIDGSIETQLADTKNAPAASGVIDAVEYLGTKGSDILYKVRSGKCTMDVTLVSKPAESIGPAQYEVQPAKLMQCARK